MLQKFVETLCDELHISPVPRAVERVAFFVPLRPDLLIALKDLDPGVSMQAPIAPCPEKKREELFLYLMRANLLGQGTGGARIGLDPSEKFLTLSLGLPYELNYPSFKENLEDFVNYLSYWKEEVAKFISDL